jgi:hypothetical protein
MNVTITISATGDTEDQGELEELKALIDGSLNWGTLETKEEKDKPSRKPFAGELDDISLWEELLLDITPEYPMRRILDLLVANNYRMMMPQVAEQLNMRRNQLPPAMSQLKKLCMKYNLVWPMTVPMRPDGYREYILENENLKRLLEASSD